MAVMFMVVVHGASNRVEMAVMSVAVRMSFVAVVVRMFMDKIDLEQQIIIRNDVRERSVRCH
jgi:hypothetical protein